MTAIEISPQFELVLNFINRTNQNIFLTGKAGTGKTTLLKYIRQHSFKQISVVAPTGVAAINAGGSTIHSFFQFAFNPFLPALKENGIPDFSKSNLPVLKYNSQRLNIFRNLELLIIDEISMVRADMLDQIDATLRQTRKKWHLPFGGVQLLLIGDMYQLPPVVQPDEWRILSEVYSSPFFFDSLVIRNAPPVFIELEKIFRQSEQTFISLLNKVRNNQLDESAVELLNSRYREHISAKDYSENITLTTHNRKADEINLRNLENLNGTSFTYKCKVEGVFSEKNYPVEEALTLKLGARVMFLKNNTERNYYNGKIGLVTFLDKEKIKVKCEEDKVEIDLEREVWNNVSYKVDKATKHIEEEILGTFTHFPLQLAWAITIHKSQGLTFNKLIIDAAHSFSAGQVYVALSRCSSLEGLTLSSRINRNSLLNDGAILNFSSSKQSSDEVTEIYRTSQQKYAVALILELFDFSEQIQNLREAAAVIQISNSRINTGIDWFTNLSTEISNLNDVASKFKNQLISLTDRTNDTESDENLQERIRKAAAYFEMGVSNITQLMKNCTLVTESKETASELNEQLQNLFESLYLKNNLIKTCTSGFHFTDFVKQKLNTVYPDFKINTYASSKNIKVSAEVKYPRLYKKLLLHRDDICNEEMKPIYLVANNKTLIELTNYLPDKPEHLLQISGFGKARAEAYGQGFLDIIREFIVENDLQTHMDSKAPKKKRKEESEKISGDEFLKGKGVKVSTKEQTFNLYKSGFSLEEIAKQRGLTLATIESHLTPYITKGEIDISKLVAEEKQKVILKALDGFNEETGLAVVKAKLPDSISFSEIKYVLANKKREVE